MSPLYTAEGVAVLATIVQAREVDPSGSRIQARQRGEHEGRCLRAGLLLFSPSARSLACDSSERSANYAAMHRS
ncbi:hypothetical protein SAMN05443247_11730 [Bradyrhizobium erythrophlei]|nr:hypothetical protein SAMN05443247_11730 [Bradyrhizobium erythrophlei]